MAEVIVKEDCVINLGEGGEHFALGARVDITSKDTALSLARMGRVRFLKKNEWDKNGDYVIDSDEQKAIDQQLDARELAARQAAEKGAAKGSGKAAA